MSNRVLPTELTEDLKDILGRPCFQCISLAQCLRIDGQTIPNRAEEEQAAVIFWLLGFYLDDPANWRANASEAINDIQVASIKAIEAASADKMAQEKKT